MGKSKQYISEGAAIELLRRIFGQTEADALTMVEIYQAVGRDPIDNQYNRNWLNTVMVKLNQHNLIKPLYKYDGRKKLEKIQLTMVGKTALGRNKDGQPEHGEGGADVTSVPRVGANYNDIAKAVAIFRRDNPEYDVTFEVKLKEVTTS